MKIFKSMGTGKCLICGEGEGGEVILAGIDGTRDGGVEEAAPIHLECLELRVRYGGGSEQASPIIYQLVR